MRFWPRTPTCLYYSDAATLIHINQYYTDKKCLEKNNWDADEKIPNTSRVTTTTVLSTKISEVENKVPGASSLVTRSC